MDPISIQIARAVIFDIRNAETNDQKFMASAEALYEVCLLAHAGTSKTFSYLSLVLVGVKGYEVLLDMQPLIELEPSFKRAFGKLKQMMRISNQSAIYTSIKTTELILEDVLTDFKKKCVDLRTFQLEITFISATEEKIIERELGVFLLSAECSNLNQLAVVHLAPSEMFRQLHKEQVQHKKLIWQMSEEKGDNKIFFKSWLIRKRKNWKLEIAGYDGQKEWTTRVDIEDIVFDLHGWPNRISANFCESDGLGLLQDGNENTLEIIKWVRSDGVPEWLIHGLPRRLSPAENATRETFSANYMQFCSLSHWLAKEELIAIARLRPYNQVTDYFVLKPGSDGSLLLRDIVPHELILPPSENHSVVSDIDEDTGPLSTPKEIFYEEIRSAYLQLPSRTSLRSTDQSNIVEILELHAFKEVGVAGSKSKAALPKSRKALR